MVRMVTRRMTGNAKGVYDWQEEWGCGASVVLTVICFLSYLWLHGCLHFIKLNSWHSDNCV